MTDWRRLMCRGRDEVVVQGLVALIWGKKTIVTASAQHALVSPEAQQMSLYRKAEPALRRLLDVVLSVVALVLLAPFLLGIALVIWLTSPGPVLFVRQRVGQDGELFPFFKFRTMVVDAHEQRDEVLGAPSDDMTDVYREDPRITPVGRFLRRWSMDELPQLVNVAAGQMSIVGPRPILPEELDLLEDSHHDRHIAKPGLTGLWQISGRKETTWEERMDLDLEYVQTRTFGSDLRIIRKTVGVIVRGDGAY